MNFLSRRVILSKKQILATPPDRAFGCIFKQDATRSQRILILSASAKSRFLRAASLADRCQDIGFISGIALEPCLGIALKQAKHCRRSLQLAGRHRITLIGIPRQFMQAGNGIGRIQIIRSTARKSASISVASASAAAR